MSLSCGQLPARKSALAEQAILIRSHGPAARASACWFGLAMKPATV